LSAPRLESVHCPEEVSHSRTCCGLPLEPVHTREQAHRVCHSDICPNFRREIVVFNALCPWIFPSLSGLLSPEAAADLAALSHSFLIKGRSVHDAFYEGIASQGFAKFQPLVPATFVSGFNAVLPGSPNFVSLASSIIRNGGSTGGPVIYIDSGKTPLTCSLPPTEQPIRGRSTIN
jgi:hypothetical protein